MRLAGIALEYAGDAILWVAIASIAAHIAAVLTRRHWPVGEVVEDVALLVANIVYAIGRDGLVRRMREVAKPGPVLRPVPGGAG